MRRWTGLFAAATLCLALAACGAGRPLVDAGSSIFHSLEVSGTAAELDVTLAETEASFLALELAEAAEATLHYTYSTGDQRGVQLRVTPPEGEAVVYDLAAATEEAYGAIWVDETVTLPAGTTVFSLTGEGVSCRMQLEVQGLDEGNVLDARMA